MPLLPLRVSGIYVCMYVCMCTYKPSSEIALSIKKDRIEIR
jgi:hypothetical protein